MAYVLTSWLTAFGFCQVSVDVPDQKGRLEILKVHARNKKLGDDIDLSEVASRVPGFTGADLANLLNEVSYCFLVHGIQPILPAHVPGTFRTSLANDCIWHFPSNC